MKYLNPPVTSIENIDTGTRLGIEIEICITEKKYRELGYGKNMTRESTSPDVYRFKGTHPFRVGEDLNQILLVTDPTCECEEGFINAEIVSPKMDYLELPVYLNFLEKVVFNDPSQFKQGETCGIHIHWSNGDMMKYKNNLEYLFYYFKLITNLRQKLDFKLVNSHFSGRQFYYGVSEKELVLNIFDIFNYNSYSYVAPFEFRLDNYKTKGFAEIVYELNSQKKDI